MSNGTDTGMMTLPGLPLEEGERIIFYKKPGWEFWLWWGIMCVAIIGIPFLFLALRSRGKAVVLTNRRIVRYNGSTNPSFPLAEVGGVEWKSGLFSAGYFHKVIVSPKDGSAGNKFILTHLGKMSEWPLVEGALRFWSGTPGVDADKAPALGADGIAKLPSYDVDIAMADGVSFILGSDLGKGMVIATPTNLFYVESKYENHGPGRSSWGVAYPIASWFPVLASNCKEAGEFVTQLQAFLSQTKIRYESTARAEIKKIRISMGQLMVEGGSRVPSTMTVPKAGREAIAEYLKAQGYPVA